MNALCIRYREHPGLRSGVPMSLVDHGSERPSVTSQPLNKLGSVAMRTALNVTAQTERIDATIAALYLRQSLAVTDPDLVIPENATPKEVAKAYIKANRKNRTVSRSVYEEYAAVMQRGEWALTHQGISFDETGALQDGQHRLLAIIFADVEIDIFVVRGVAATSFSKVDTGRGRPLAQILGIDLDANSGRGLSGLSSIATMMYRCFTDRPNVGYASRVTNEEGREFVRLNLDLTNYVEAAMEAQRKTGMTTSAAGVAFYLTERSPLYANVTDAKWAEWYDGFIHHNNLAAGDVRHLLHTRLRAIETEEKQNARPYIGLAYYLKALDAHFNNRSMRVLKLGPDERKYALIRKSVRDLGVVNLPAHVTLPDAA